MTAARRVPHALAVLALLAACTAAPRPVPAPTPADPAPASATGADLVSAATPIQVGDRIDLQVAGEPELTGVFTVLDGPSVGLPTIGVVPLASATRGTLQPYLTAALGKYLRHPVVQARPLLWVGVVGEVAKPGFYALPADALLSDALMAAGGMTRTAQVKQVHVQRANAQVVNPLATALALAKGLTIAQVGIQSGDEVMVPLKPDAERTTRMITYLLTIPLSIFAILKII